MPTKTLIAFVLLTSAVFAAATPCTFAELLSTKKAELVLFQGAVTILGGGPPELLPVETQNQLVTLSGVKSADDLGKQENQRTLMASMRQLLGPENFAVAIGHYGQGLARLAQSMAQAPSFADHREMNRGWGWHLLPEDDAAFHDPAYLTNVLRHSRAAADVMGQTFDEQAGNEVTHRFYRAWSKLVPQASIRSLTLTGSDANNLLYDIAHEVARSRDGHKEDPTTDDKNSPARTSAPDAEILIFGKAYGAGRGRMARRSYMAHHETGHLMIIEDPASFTAHPTTAEAAAELEYKENKALDDIRAKASEPKNRIGGIFFEPIPGITGVRFYRPSFLRAFRRLADELKIPIFADEILTGGGRTGKFFAYQHYEDFEPDYVTFGKGLLLAGVAKINRREQNPQQPLTTTNMVTLRQYYEPMMKATQLLDRIRTGNLMDNAASSGAYFLERLRQVMGVEGARGKGLMIHAGAWRPAMAKDAMGRLLPPLTLTREQIDELFTSSMH